MHLETTVVHFLLTMGLENAFIIVGSLATYILTYPAKKVNPILTHDLAPNLMLVDLTIVTASFKSRLCYLLEKDWLYLKELKENNIYLTFLAFSNISSCLKTPTSAPWFNQNHEFTVFLGSGIFTILYCKNKLQKHFLHSAISNGILSCSLSRDLTRDGFTEMKRGNRGCLLKIRDIEE